MRKTRAAPRIALALAGGGPLAAVYEIGALCALEEAVDGLDCTRLQHYVGVSAGGFIAASLANGLSPRALCAAFVEDGGGEAAEAFDPAWLMVPAYAEFARRALRLPLLAASALAGPWRWAALLAEFGPAIPTGLFANEEIHRRLARVFSQGGRSNDFRQLRARLSLVATDLDSGDAVALGGKGWDHVPISRAVQATAALPGLFPPVDIDGHSFVDGALKKTLHASVALEEGTDLLLCLNPLAPYRGTARIAEGGLPAVLGQTLRALIHSRLEAAMRNYARAYPGTDIVLLEPEPDDARVHLASAFSYRRRRELAEHAYRQTRAQLLARHGQLAPMFARHGLVLRADLLADTSRSLIAQAPPRHRLGRTLADLGQALDSIDRRLRPA
ncbi:patatin-like phospholipase family protein [Ramlibacter sp. XY19]|uniref:patatin-like phospholipase family protein n=1 Tax=Ramlibacter paludis TaxID=2908000 RepID=UPI0023DC3E13|nr:patatin-like phospholipase family protein [Ramlibacter paludis]MCG2591246.1 patatin-like phospholipase family protein [Ramlibacter paludis]